MKITVPEGEKAQIVNAVCKFIGFKTEGVIEAGAVNDILETFIEIGILIWWRQDYCNWSEERDYCHYRKG